MNSSKRLVLGIDTSNYTTSAALCSLDGQIVANLKLPLPVKPGDKGLRQSEALFHHVNRLPELLSALKTEGRLAAVGYSARPRDVQGSYMPCFLAGKAAGYAAAAAADVPLYSFSHQCGHIMAAIYSAGMSDISEKEFYAFHVSGGTTEVLCVSPDRDTVFSAEKIGGTLDLNAGQVIDRIGVKMGLSFPCGRELEKLAIEYTGKTEVFKVKSNGLFCNLSGLENKASELYAETEDKPRVAAYVIRSIGCALQSLTDSLLSQGESKSVVYAGGVMSNSIIKEMLKDCGGFAAPEFSSDNAAGCALLARRAFLSGREGEI